MVLDDAPHHFVLDFKIGEGARLHVEKPSRGDDYRSRAGSFPLMWVATWSRSAKSISHRDLARYLQVYEVGVRPRVDFFDGPLLVVRQGPTPFSGGEEPSKEVWLIRYPPVGQNHQAAIRLVHDADASGATPALGDDLPGVTK